MVKNRKSVVARLAVSWHDMAEELMNNGCPISAMRLCACRPLPRDLVQLLRSFTPRRGL